MTLLSYATHAAAFSLGIIIMALIQASKRA